MNMKIPIAAIVLILAAGSFVSATYMSQAPGSTSEQSSPAVKEITVAVGPDSEFSFDKSNLQLSRGDSVKLTFKNTGQVIHNLVIPEFSAGTPTIGPGQESSTHFTASRSGSFEYLCTIPGHKERGMLGLMAVA